MFHTLAGGTPGWTAVPTLVTRCRELVAEVRASAETHPGLAEHMLAVLGRGIVEAVHPPEDR